MGNSTDRYQVVIAGAGAVGLFLGLCLRYAGISCLILEKRKNVREGSRSLGIHPVSLELFQKLGIARPFVEAGVKIQQGHAFANTRPLGTLSFAACAGPFNYILALPQHQTETILEQQLKAADNDVLLRGAEVTDIHQTEQQAHLTYERDGSRHQVSAQFLVGCDGKHSFVRKQAQLSFHGSTYPDTYIMGDYIDNTDFGSDAAIFLCDDGLVESFPLPENRRRWVVKTEHYISKPDRFVIDRKVAQRVGHDLNDTKPVMLSSFGVQRLIAEQMVKNRIILAGDAAHVVSPIGGQGMNLGWLDGWDLAQCLKKILGSNKKTHSPLRAFEQRRKKAARNAIRRAEINMRLGRQARFPALRNALISLMLTKPLSKWMANIFTMRGVERWPI